jgi:hypothetical protein
MLFEVTQSRTQNMLVEFNERTKAIAQLLPKPLRYGYQLHIFPSNIAR